MSYLEIFEDDVETAVTLFLESEPLKKQRQIAPQHEELEGVYCNPPQKEQMSSPVCDDQTDRRQEPQEVSSPQPGEACKREETFVVQTLRNNFKSDFSSGTAETTRKQSGSSGTMSSPGTKNEEVFAKLQQFLDCKLYTSEPSSRPGREYPRASWSASLRWTLCSSQTCRGTSPCGSRTCRDLQCRVWMNCTRRPQRRIRYSSRACKGL